VAIWLQVIFSEYSKVFWIGTKSVTYINLYISREEIFDCIKKLKNDKASGEDGIINEYIKSTAHQFINIYEKLWTLRVPVLHKSHLSRGSMWK
jgi:hypothetical protein